MQEMAATRHRLFFGPLAGSALLALTFTWEPASWQVTRASRWACTSHPW
jgi:hypothetical protein